MVRQMLLHCDTPGATLKVNFPTPLIGVQKLELMLYTGSVTGEVIWNMQSTNQQRIPQQLLINLISHAWNDATSLLTDGTVSDIYIRLKGSPNGAARAIRVTNSTGTFIVETLVQLMSASSTSTRTTTRSPSTAAIGLQVLGLYRTMVKFWRPKYGDKAFTMTIQTIAPHKQTMQIVLNF